MSSEIYSVMANLYHRRIISQEEFVEHLITLGYDASTIDSLLSIENKAWRKQHADRKRNDNAMRGKDLSDS